jgi:hypothetical protein
MVHSGGNRYWEAWQRFMGHDFDAVLALYRVTVYGRRGSVYVVFRKKIWHTSPTQFCFSSCFLTQGSGNVGPGTWWDYQIERRSRKTEKHLQEVFFLLLRCGDWSSMIPLTWLPTSPSSGTSLSRLSHYCTISTGCSRIFGFSKISFCDKRSEAKSGLKP